MNNILLIILIYFLYNQYITKKKKKLYIRIIMYKKRNFIGNSWDNYDGYLEFVDRFYRRFYD